MYTLEGLVETLPVDELPMSDELLRRLREAGGV